MACASSCTTPGAHASWAACIRAQHQHVAYCQSADGKDYSRQKRWDRDLDAYRDAVRQGIEPRSTNRGDVDTAVRVSNETGVAYVGG